jgi:hypothetical protein
MSPALLSDLGTANQQAMAKQAFVLATPVERQPALQKLQVEKRAEAG